jgi:cytochrome c oxidase subunit 4
MSGMRSTVLVWLALLVLLAISAAGSFIFTGPLNLLVSFGTAGLKALLIFWFYIHLKEEGGLNRIFALGAILWLALLMTLPAVDMLTRESGANGFPMSASSGAGRD